LHASALSPQHHAQRRAVMTRGARDTYDNHACRRASPVRLARYTGRDQDVRVRDAARHAPCGLLRLRLFTERGPCRPPMSWDSIEENWRQFKGKLKEQWGRSTDDQLDVIAGKRDVLIGKAQEAYGISNEEAERQVAEWKKREPEDLAY
jgi:uncharacterized protein YjbJ (UPF0337 family)